MNHRELLIGGHFVGGPCDQSTAKGVSRSPWSGSVVGTVAEGGFRELTAAIEAAHDAFPDWSRSSPAGRQQLLRRVHGLVRERADELAQLLVAEIGKPITFAQAEVERLAITFELAAKELDQWQPETPDLGPDSRRTQYQVQVDRVAKGVVFAIVPYNWPHNLAAHKLAPALAVGNTVVLKVSPLAQMCGLELGRLLHDAGCPPGVVNVWNGETRDVIKALNDPRIAMLSFTGSAAVGWSLRDQWPRRDLVLELGGDASALVFSDADLDWAAASLTRSAYGYAGQVCISAQHVRVQDSVYESMRDRLVLGTVQCPTGDPESPETVCGPLISEAAADRVESWIREAEGGGARVLVRGIRDHALLGPTLIENLPSECKLATEEVFGPVLCLHRFHDLDEAIAHVNQSRFGIHASVYTHDPAVFQACVHQLEVGGVIQNDAPSTRLDALPYGGLKESGLGWEGVRFAMNEYSRPRCILRKKFDSTYR